MSPPLREETAQQLIKTVRNLGRRASFGRILLEANKQGVLAWHRTLRRYLDLLSRGGVLRISERDVGSVNPQQTYKITGSKPTVWTGLTVLSTYGLNWDAGADLHPMTTDITGLLRSKPHNLNSTPSLKASLEDALIHELEGDLHGKTTGRTELVAAVLTTRPVDLPYLLRRADEKGIGKATRLLIKNLIDTFSSLPGEADGRTFLQTREKFLRTLRVYTSKGHLKLLDESGRGRTGIAVVESLTPVQVITTAAKQLGVSG